MRRLAAIVVSVLALGALRLAGPAGGTTGPDADNASPANRYGWFEADLVWRGDFGDPHVVRVGSTYYAYSSPTGGRYLPVLVSTDLQTWRIHPRWSASPAPWAGGPAPSTDPSIPIEIRRSSMSEGDKWNMNDGLVQPPTWALPHDQGPWIKADYWAPGVTEINGTWYAYGAVKVSDHSDDVNGYGRFCITVAAAPGPLGPFRDVSGGGPIVCDVDPAGSIDPAPFRDPATGEHHLLWKAAGRRSLPGVQGYPSALKAQRLGHDGRPAPGSHPVTLLTTNEGSWEGMTIENPSMVHWNGTYYLFYSGNSSVPGADGSSDYATGYAICPSGPLGGCFRPVSDPLLHSSGTQRGLAGGSAFVDSTGGLRIAHNYFLLGENRTDTWINHPRRLLVTQLVPGGYGTLRPGTPTVVNPRPIDDACPSGLPTPTFSDVPSTMSAAPAIGCIAGWGITAGTSPTTFSPAATTTRGQLASFLTRLIDQSSRPLPSSVGDAFADDAGSVHEHSIDRLAAAGLVAGVAPGRFSPDAPVTREQMATFLRRGIEHVIARQVAEGADVFHDDDGSVHQAAINALAARGVATGVLPGAFAPRAATTRAQMAVFVARTLDVLVDGGSLPPPR